MNTALATEEAPYTYVIGIDLGTTNTALAFVNITEGGAAERVTQLFEVPQLISAGEVARRPVLPSFLYIPGSFELPPRSTALPWDVDRTHAVGEFAREQGALVPGRMVSSAKSWLCHGGVDRTAPILPWGADPEVAKISPVEASSLYLGHLREAWNHLQADGDESGGMEEQLILLTVPASFDEVARELTVTAAHKAGLNRVILVEEPLAAFYAWISRHESNWRDQMSPGQLMLVCDIGGGTSDFTVIAVREGEHGLRFDRLAVGEHLLLGGDNMDLALARHLEIQLLGQPGKLDSRRWHQLWHQCRKAKEILLSGESRVESADITVMGTGGKLIADTLKGTLSRRKAEELIIEGFFPFVSPEDSPTALPRAGLTEWGLPFVQDPAITRHLAYFWRRSLPVLERETGRTSLYPDYILFNGGALTPPSIRNRIKAVVGSWFTVQAGEGWTPVELENPRPELAVAAGAAYYGLVRLGEGVRIGAGSPRTFYAEIANRNKEPSESTTVQAVCLVPRGTEEGFEATLDQPAFEVLTNQPVSFQVRSSSTRLGDRLGDVVNLDESETTPLPPVRTILRFGKKSTAQNLPVRLAVRLTEIGTLELWCRSLKTPHQWQLQFDVRQERDAHSLLPDTGETVDTAFIQQAQDRITTIFSKGTRVDENPPERLVKELASILDLPKEKWPTSLIRKLADTLLRDVSTRFPTPRHESRWLNLLGYCLRPGFGAPLDDWRIGEAWKIFPAGLQFPRQAQGRSEWWIFWRRVAGGLNAGRQLRIFQEVFPLLQVDERKRRKTAKTTARNVNPQEQIEALMALANMERLPVNAKQDLAEILLERIRKDKPKPQDLWAIGRLGARIPFYGPLNEVVPAQVVSSWLNILLSLDLEPSESSARVFVQLARRTGDRERDLPPSDVEKVAFRLEQLPHGSRFKELLDDPDGALRSMEQDWIFGETLPGGLAVVPDTLE